MNTITATYFHIESPADGVVHIYPKNTNQQLKGQFIPILKEFFNLALQLLDLATTKGLIYSSPLDSASNDYRTQYDVAQDTVSFAQHIQELSQLGLALHKHPKPTVALLETDSFDSALSSIFWAKERIGIAGSKLGFPAAAYGLYPGFGSSSLISKSVALDYALPFLSQGRILPAAIALEQGLLHAVCTDSLEGIQLATQFIRSPSATDTDKNKRLTDDSVFKNLAAQQVKKAKGLKPEMQRYLDLLQQLQASPIEEALALETQFTAELWQQPALIGRLRTQYYALEAAKSTPAGQQGDFIPQKIGILGAGMMGAGIAYEAARAGMQVILKDVTQQQAEHGKSYAEKVSQKQVERAGLKAEERTQLLARIHATENMEDLRGADIIVEAVFEDKSLKAEVTKQSAPLLGAEGIFASNSTSIPITELAKASDRPESFIGMHFFSPVDRMDLLEIIRGKHSSDETLSKALQIARLLGKTPIVVHDGPAFFTSRIFFNYLLEAVTMLLEGIPAVDIEAAAQQAGFAVGPLAVLDEISVPLMLHVYAQLPTLHNSQQRAYNYLQSLINLGRSGRKAGQGFYDYDKATASKNLWQDPSISLQQQQPEALSLQTRFLHVVALDSYRCLAEGILTRPIDGDIGSIMGIGYAAQTGGVFSHIDQVGIAQFVKDCQDFAPFGEQWALPASLAQLANNKFSFYRGFTSNWSKHSPKD